MSWPCKTLSGPQNQPPKLTMANTLEVGINAVGYWLRTSGRQLCDRQRRSVELTAYKEHFPAPWGTDGPQCRPRDTIIPSWRYVGSLARQWREGGHCRPRLVPRLLSTEDNGILLFLPPSGCMSRTVPTRCRSPPRPTYPGLISANHGLRRVTCRTCVFCSQKSNLDPKPVSQFSCLYNVNLAVDLLLLDRTQQMRIYVCTTDTLSGSNDPSEFSNQVAPSRFSWRRKSYIPAPCVL
ncbi:hypothetical protein BT67DRAFT_71353 [Trichocladium antarcticum]|uniref:Uncharacterized protein n=1 Tax=Trichocladium antarcticum TaxID=1450529 RepID=A0AAN6ZCH5_9PEZI|nr:hypothetical protein BT67DRAFT_71353 [Trichocladium antarcticum]